jgi:hypothetical protein
MASSQNPPYKYGGMGDSSTQHTRAFAQALAKNFGIFSG